jgi:hypothetical protein
VLLPVLLPMPGMVELLAMDPSILEVSRWCAHARMP